MGMAMHGGGWFDPATQKFTINRKENVAALGWIEGVAAISAAGCTWTTGRSATRTSSGPSN